jgi:hypothetical protein
MAKPTANSIRVTVHVVDGEAFTADIDDLPGPRDTFVRFRNLRGRDDKPPTWLSKTARSVIYSATHITFIEVHDSTEAIGWVR